MSLGSDLTPWLSGLRSYAGLILNHPAKGDEVFRRTLEHIVDNPAVFPVDVSARVALYRVFETSIKESENHEAENVPTDKYDAPLAFSTMGRLSLIDRKVIFLTGTEGFRVPEISYILNIPENEVKARIDGAFALNPKPILSDVMVVEPHPDIANHIVSLTEEAGFDVVGVVNNVAAALAMARATAPDIVVSETRLNSGSVFSLIEGLKDFGNPEVIIVTGDPDDLKRTKTTPHVAAVLPKPFSNESYTNALRLVASKSIPETPETKYSNNDLEAKALEILSASPVPYAPEVKVRSGVVDFVQKKPNTSVPVEHLNALRLDHAEDISRAAILGNNLGAGFTSRMQKAITLLSQPLTEESMLRLANQAQGLTGFIEAAHIELLPAAASDIEQVITSLMQFSMQSPAWRNFLAATEQPEGGASDARHTVANLAQTLQGAPGLLSERVSDAISEAENDLGREDVKSTAYYSGLIHNIFSAMGRYAMARASGIKAKFNEKVDEEISTFLVSTVSTTLIAASTPLLAMATNYPANWAWVGPALATIQALKRLANDRK